MNGTRTQFTIYALHDGDGRFFYVGCTRAPLARRLTEHRYKARHGGPSRVHAVMREVGPSHVRIALLESASDETAGAYLEAGWIEALIEAGYPVTNDIARDGVPFSMGSDEIRKRLAARRSGAQWTEMQRATITERNENRVPEHGTRQEYEYRECRCTECRAFMAKRRRDYLARRAEKELA